jgi:hypothetical protein
MIRLAVLHSTIGRREKLLAEAARNRASRCAGWMSVRPFRFAGRAPQADAALERSVSTVKGDYAPLLGGGGFPVLNPPAWPRVPGQILNFAGPGKAGMPGTRFALASISPGAERW